MPSNISQKQTEMITKIEDKIKFGTTKLKANGIIDKQYKHKARRRMATLMFTGCKQNGFIHSFISICDDNPLHKTVLVIKGNRQ